MENAPASTTGLAPVAGSTSPLAEKLRQVTSSLARGKLDFGSDVAVPIDPSKPSSGIGTIIDLPRIPDARGVLTFIEGGRHVPFDIQRIYYLYDVPGGATRGGHAHRNLHQLLISIAGSFDIILDNGQQVERYSLNRSYYGLHIPPMTWREMDNFSSGAVCLVLASEHYDESDYYRKYDEFLLDALKQQ